MILTYQEYEQELQNLLCKAGINYIEVSEVRKSLVDPLLMGLSGNYVVKSGAKPVPIIGKTSPQLLSGEVYLCNYPPFNPRENGNPDSYSDDQFRSDYGLIYSAIPDLVIAPKNSPESFVTVRVESPSPSREDLVRDSKYKVQGAQKLIQLCNEETVKAIYDYCSGKCTNLPPEVSNIDSKEQGPDIVTFSNGKIIELFQEDWNVLDLRYAQKVNVRSVILTNGIFVRRFYLKADQIESSDYNLNAERDFDTFRGDIMKDLG